MKQEEEVARLHNEAYQYLDYVMNTDAIFLYPPAQIALAMLAKAVATLHLDTLWKK